MKCLHRLLHGRQELIFAAVVPFCTIRSQQLLSNAKAQCLSEQLTAPVLKECKNSKEREQEVSLISAHGKCFCASFVATCFLHFFSLLTSFPSSQKSYCSDSQWLAVLQNNILRLIMRIHVYIHICFISLCCLMFFCFGSALKLTFPFFLFASTAYVLTYFMLIWICSVCFIHFPYVLCESCIVLEPWCSPVLLLYLLLFLFLLASRSCSTWARFLPVFCHLLSCFSLSLPLQIRIQSTAVVLFSKVCQSTLLIPLFPCLFLLPFLLSCGDVRALSFNTSVCIACHLHSF